MSTNPEQPDPDEAVINWAAALEYAGNDEKLLADVVTIFLDEASERMADVRRSIEEGDAELLRRSAHTLKGCLRIFEPERATEYAAQLEQAGKNEQLDQAPNLLKELEPQMELVIAELQRHAQS
jgi:HPt (histidine-containing phosphotransfer) domain-containing protein